MCEFKSHPRRQIFIIDNGAGNSAIINTQEENMFLCQDCGAIFDAPNQWQETHGLEHAPFEHFSGCPICAGAYCFTYQCDKCGQWITDDYIKIDTQRYCQNCYQSFQPGEED